jgi:hypothetical protein
VGYQPWLHFLNFASARLPELAAPTRRSVAFFQAQDVGEAHLRRLLRTYARYYNDIRTHRSLDKDAPVSRPVQWVGSINSHAILGGLHHHYVRV